MTDQVRHYVLIDNYSGYVWGEANAADPIAACRIVDENIGIEQYEYEARHLGNSTVSGYHVYEAPADWVPVKDGLDGAEIERVLALRRVAQVAYKRATACQCLYCRVSSR